jgi:hypothetical protein
MSVRVEVHAMVLLPTVLVAACSCGCGGDPGGGHSAADSAADTAEATSASAALDLGVPAVPCAHLYFGEVDQQWSLYTGADFLVAADLDGDGLRDLVVSQDHAPIALFRNRGRDPASTSKKSFDAAVKPEGSNSFGFGVTDFTNDGLPDVIGRSNRIQLLANRGDFVFETVQDEVQDLFSSSHILMADMDGDAREDVILYGGRGITIYPAPDSSGVLGEPSLSIEPGGVDLRRGDVGDLDGDGRLDLAIAGFVGEPLVVTAFGDGQGGLERITQYSRPELRGSMAQIVDVDVDGQLDVVISGSTMEPSPDRYLERKARVVWMRGIGGGQLEEAAVIELPVGGLGFYAQHADLDGDGVPEIVVMANGYVVEDGPENIPGAYHLLSYREGGLEVVAPAFIDSGQAYDRFLLDDIDGDGRIDLIRAAGGLAVHWGCEP